MSGMIDDSTSIPQVLRLCRRIAKQEFRLFISCAPPHFVPLNVSAEGMEMDWSRLIADMVHRYAKARFRPYCVENSLFL